MNVDTTTLPVPRADALTAHLNGEAVVLDLGTHKYFRLNATSASIWAGLERRQSRRAVVDSLVATFAIDAEAAEAALAEHLDELRRAGLLA